MEEAARIVSEILKDLARECRVGQTGKELALICDDLIKEHGATSYNKDYLPAWGKVPFPSSLCVSPNGVIIHGIPNDYEFKEGDIVTLDLGIKKDGFCGDAAITVPIGKIEPKHERLIYYAKKAVYEYIAQLKPGANTRDLALHMETWASQMGYRVNRRGAGHTIGVEMHMKPSLYNTVEDDVHTYADLAEGMIVCIEPILTQSRDSVGMLLSDGWSVVTMDGKFAAMFEHMVKITKDGAEILTDHFSLDNPAERN